MSRSGLHPITTLAINFSCPENGAQFMNTLPKGKLAEQVEVLRNRGWYATSLEDLNCLEVLLYLRPSEKEELLNKVAHGLASQYHLSPVPPTREVIKAWREVLKEHRPRKEGESPQDYKNAYFAM